MRKGFIFTTDALFAAAIVIIAMSFLLLQYNPGETGKALMKSLKNEVEWKRQVGFYSLRGAEQMGLHDSNESFKNQDFGYCKALFYYFPQANGLSGNGTLYRINFCGGREG